MELFADMGKKVTGLARSLGKRTSAAARSGRLSARREETAQRMLDLYGRIGRAYFETRQESEQTKARELCGEMEDLIKEASRLEAMIHRLNNRQACAQCQMIQPLSARFCCGCGARLTAFPEGEGQARAEDSGEDMPENLLMEDGGSVAVEINWPHTGPKTPDSLDRTPPHKEESFCEE